MGTRKRCESAWQQVAYQDLNWAVIVDGDRAGEAKKSSRDCLIFGDCEDGWVLGHNATQGATFYALFRNRRITDQLFLLFLSFYSFLFFVFFWGGGRLKLTLKKQRTSWWRHHLHTRWRRRAWGQLGRRRGQGGYRKSQRKMGHQPEIKNIELLVELQVVCH